jgi:hypothetical protein
MNEAQAKKHFKCDKFILRGYDRYDHVWTDQASPASWDDTIALYNKNTKNGSRYTEQSEDYYQNIFPGNSKMLFS